MNFKRALITGGAGLVGSHIADLLVRDGLDEIVIVDNFTRGRRDNLANALASGTITIVEGDVRDRKLMAIRSRIVRACDDNDRATSLSTLRVVRSWFAFCFSVLCRRPHSSIRRCTRA